MWILYENTKGSFDRSNMQIMLFNKIFMSKNLIEISGNLYIFSYIHDFVEILSRIFFCNQWSSINLHSYDFDETD